MSLAQVEYQATDFDASTNRSVSTMAHRKFRTKCALALFTSMGLTVAAAIGISGTTAYAGSGDSPQKPVPLTGYCVSGANNPPCTSCALSGNTIYCLFPPTNGSPGLCQSDDKVTTYCSGGDQDCGAAKLCATGDPSGGCGTEKYCLTTTGPVQP